MTHYIPEILLWLFILNLGVAYGAGLYETRIILPQWFIQSSGLRLQVNTQAMRETDTGRRFWGFVTTLPLTLLTLANLLVAWQSNGSIHDWWFAAALITLVERIGTFSFFIPTAIKLMHDDALALSRAMLWIRLNYVRNTFTLIGWLAALKTLSLIS